MPAKSRGLGQWRGGRGKGDGAQVTAVRGTVGAGAGPFFRARGGSLGPNFETEKKEAGVLPGFFFSLVISFVGKSNPPPLCWGGGGFFLKRTQECPFERVSSRLRKFGGGPQVRKGPLAWCWLGDLIPSDGGVLSGLRKG